MDTSKKFFQLHGVNAAERPVLRKQLRRRQVLPFLAKLQPTVIGGASHYWAREILGLGHAPKLVPPQYAKAYVKRGKNDAVDAAAICEATGRPSMRFVPVKSAENQAALMLAGMRGRLVRTQTQLSNAIRGYAAEFGLIAPKGKWKLELLLAGIREDEALPVLARELFELHAQEYAQVTARLAELERRMMAWHRNDECSRRLAKIPGIGAIGASLLVMKTPDPHLFDSARSFAAWLGLTPRDHSTAGKQRLGVITRAGDEHLRAVLVSGAMAGTQPGQTSWPQDIAGHRQATGAQADQTRRRGSGQPKRADRMVFDGTTGRLRSASPRAAYHRAVLGTVKDACGAAPRCFASLTAPARGAR
jgi:transposase